MKKVIVTGTRGFIGVSLMNELDKLGYFTYGFDDSYLSENNWTEKLLQILETLNYDAVFHVGACSDTLEQNVEYMMTRNYESTKIIMDWCIKNNKPMIYSSSAANYGVNNLYPANLYGWSKYVAEGYVISNGGIALRYFNVYGPGEENKGKMASVAYQMFQKNKKDEKIFLFPKKPQRDFVYVKDVISANIHALLNYDKLRGSYYEVGSGEARTFEDVLNNMEITFGYTSEDLIPNGYQFYTCSDKLKWMNGWESQWNLEKGILDYKKYLVG
jgi:ADP-L-glycero-D-manno-heptose 6-epimerase